MWEGGGRRGAYGEGLTEVGRIREGREAMSTSLDSSRG